MELRQPFRVHNVYTHPSWHERFRGQHPPEIERMRADIREGRLGIAMRPMADVDALLASPLYRTQRAILKGLYPLHHWWQHGPAPGTPLYAQSRSLRKNVRKALRRLTGVPKKSARAKPG